MILNCRVIHPLRLKKNPQIIRRQGVFPFGSKAYFMVLQHAPIEVLESDNLISFIFMCYGREWE
jgi:hypothetical protein